MKFVNSPYYHSSFSFDTAIMEKQDFFGPNIKIMKWAGLWIPDQGESPTVKCLYFIFNAVFLGYSVFLNIPMELLAFRVTYHRLDQLMKNISVGGTHTLAAIKMFVWYRNRKDILNIMRVLEAKAADYEAIDDFQATKVIEEEKSVKDLTTHLFLYLGAAVSVTAYVAAMWTFLTDYEKYEAITIGSNNETNYRYTQKLPYHMVMPFTYDSSKFTFALCLIYNCFPSFHFAWITIGIDTIFTSLVSYTSAHLRILQGAFKTIRQRCLRELKMPNTFVLRDSEQLNNAMMKEMNRCVDHLQLIFRTCQQLENIFTYLTLLQVLSSQILICACLYMVSAIPMNSKAFATELIYLVAIEMQIALYCFFGNKVTLTGQDISLAIYEGDWLSANGPFKTSMLITMSRMSRPIYLTMGKFSPLTLATFVTIGRASYSFFAVIKNK